MVKYPVPFIVKLAPELIVIFFAIAGLVYFSIGFGGVKESAAELSGQEAKELVKKIAGSAEFFSYSSSSPRVSPGSRPETR